MNVIINRIPPNWTPNNRIAFLKWMNETVQSIEYSNIID